MSGGLDLALLVGAAVLLVAVAAVRLSTRLGLPSLLVYLLIGIVLGEAGLGIRFDDAELTRTLGFCALIMIIAEGGLTARWSALRPVLALSATLSTVGVAVSIAVVGVVVHLRAGSGLAAGHALRRGALLDRRGRGLRHPAAAAAATVGWWPCWRPSPASTTPRWCCWSSCCRPRRAFTHPWWYELLVVGYELSAGAVIGLTVGAVGPLDAAPGRSARRPGSTRSRRSV